MRSLFSGYYKPSAKAFKKLWSDGIFVFDTNVLLSSYLFPAASRQAFHSVLTTLGSRVWIPYHVALEFQRNRIARIRVAGRNLESAEKALTSARGLPDLVRSTELEKRGVSEPELPAALKAYDDALQAIQNALTKAKGQLPSLSLDDTIRDQLSAVFKDRVGSPPSDQSALDKLISDATLRYDNDVPPGYKDSSKSSTKKFVDRGIYYEPKHGDLIIWKQLLDHIQSAKLKSVAFVTEDKKEDWWSIEGEKTLGPRPELVQEALQRMGDPDGIFWMYSLEQFIALAGEHLTTAVVPQVAIDQVREVSATYSTADVDTLYTTSRNRTNAEVTAVLAVIDWIIRNFEPTDVERHIRVPMSDSAAPQDVIVRLGKERWLLHVVTPEQRLSLVISQIARAVELFSLATPTFHTIVLVLPDHRRESFNRALRAVQLEGDKHENLSFLIGNIVDGEFHVERKLGPLPPFL